MAKHILILAAFSLLLTTFASAQHKRSRSWTWSPDTVVKHDAKGIVQIGIWDYTTNWLAPPQELQAALRHYRRANLFRVNWRSSIGSGSYHGTALYNRKKHLLKVHAGVADSSFLRRRYLYYTGVTQESFQKLTQFNKNLDGSDDTGNFDNLAKQGIRRTLVRQVEKGQP